MVDFRTVDHLPTIALLRQVVRKWWGIELGIADSDDRGRALGDVKLVTGKLEPGRDGAVLRPCHVGFDVIGVPLSVEGEIGGYLYVGAAPASPSLVPQLFGAELDRLVDLLEFGALEIVAHWAGERARAQRLTARDTSKRAWFEHLIGTSRAMQQVFRLLEKVIDSEATVLIHGESGTGKELVARAIHQHGPRKKRPFVVQNCSAFNDNLLESALFGHGRGSFTGAIRDQKGLFEVADTGTFFLDEVGDMSPSLQVKLLRVLESGTFLSVGASEVKQVDVRVIAATHKDLHKMVERGEFREDLYYRIHVLKVVLPPLRERLEDLPLLCDHFLAKHHHGRGLVPRLSGKAMEAWQSYAWPGNVRELENEIERLLVLGGDLDEIPVELLSARMREGDALSRSTTGNGTLAANLKESVEALERELIQEGLARTRGNKSQLAKELGISRSNLIQKCAYYGLERKGAE